MDNTIQKIDHIQEEYYVPLERAEWCSAVLFYITVILSYCVLCVSQESQHQLYCVIQILFISLTISQFILNHAISFYLKPRAEETRLQDFLSNAYGIRLNHKITQGYYNNNEVGVTKRIGMQVLENCYFSKTIISIMVKNERFLYASYIIIWIFIMLCRNSSLDLISCTAQILLGEHIISRWISLEWLRCKVERIYNTLYRNFQIAIPQENSDVIIQECFLEYERAKSKAGITLSQDIFNKINEQATKEWEKIKMQFSGKSSI